MSYRLRIEKRALKQLHGLASEMAQRVDQRITLLGSDPRPRGCLKLSGELGPGYRIRVGDIRVIYEVDDAEKLVTVLNIEPRNTAYKIK